MAVFRGGRVLDDDAEIGELRADDVIEFAPLVKDPSGHVRTSFAVSDARPDELGPCEGVFQGELRTYLVVEPPPAGCG